MGSVVFGHVCSSGSAKSVSQVGVCQNLGNLVRRTVHLPAIKKIGVKSRRQHLPMRRYVSGHHRQRRCLGLEQKR